MYISKTSFLSCHSEDIYIEERIAALLCTLYTQSLKFPCLAYVDRLVVNIINQR